MRRDDLRELWVPFALFGVDSVLAFSGLCAGWWLRYRTQLGQMVVNVQDAQFTDYLPLLLMGTGLLLATFLQLGLYKAPSLLRRLHATALIAKGACFWLFLFLCLSLVLRFVPEISRLFVVVSTVLVFCLLGLWRQLAYAIVVRTSALGRLRQRVLVYGWNENARALLQELNVTGRHPYVPLGVFGGKGEVVPEALRLGFGEVDGLPDILRTLHVDVLLCADPELPPEEVALLASICERTWTDFKVVPGRFESLVGGLRLQVVGGVPLLGLEDLPISRLFNRVFKRGMDVLGALAGLLLSAPVVLVMGYLIRKESPGPVFFAQERVGADNRVFRLWKLRSMLPDAALSDHERQSTARGDKRVLAIGRFMRRWNIDELPQFWNVLRGEMSLVGPRPERPRHADRLSGEIAHYFQRHIAKPGMTGWAQVNGLRGACDLALRIRFDHHYIENWSLWFDVQIMAMTFVRWRNRAE